MIYGFIRTGVYRISQKSQSERLTEYGVNKFIKANYFNDFLPTLEKEDTLVISCMNMLADTFEDFTGFVSELDERGVRVVTLDEAFDTGTPIGRYCLDVLVAISKFDKVGRKKRYIPINGKSRPNDEAKIRLAAKMYYSNAFTNKEILDTTGICHQTLYNYIKK